MAKGNINKNITIPNILSVARIILVAPFIYFFLEDNYVAAAVILIFSGLSDMFDGMIARKLNQITALGKILDPIADKLTLVSILICFSFKFPVLIPVVALMLLKEILMLLGGAHLINRRITPPAACWYGKVSTSVFYATTVVIVALKAIWDYQNIALTVILMSITAILMLYALVRYTIIYLKLLKEQKNH